MAEQRNSYSLKLTAAQMARLERILRGGNYRLREVPYARVSGARDDCQITVYESGKCLVQGRGTEDWVKFVLETEVTGEPRMGYEELADPEGAQPHMGVDESGKGDFFGPLVVCAAYVDAAIAKDLRAMGVRDSKTVTTDRAAKALAGKIRERLEGKWSLVTIGPEAYNRMYGKMGSVNRILAWGHAKCIELLLEKVPGCPRALSDQFAEESLIQRALRGKARDIRLDQRPKAESDMAVAAASILARAAFVDAMERLGEAHGGAALPKGASAAVRAAAEKLVQAEGGGVLLQVAKCHFKTADEVLAAAGTTREKSGLPAAPAPKSWVPWQKKGQAKKAGGGGDGDGGLFGGEGEG